MRLTYMYYLLKKNYESLNSLVMQEQYETIAGDRQSYGYMGNWINAKKALINIQRIPSMQEVANKFLQNPDLQNRKDNFRFPIETYKELHLIYKPFLERIKGVIDFCEAAELNKYPSGFDVKMPPTNDFNEFADNIDALRKVLQQCPYLNIDGETIEINSVDIGSIWMRFAIIATSTAIIFSNLATIVDKCVKIKSHMLVCRQQEEQLRTIELKNEVIESVIENNKIVTNAMVDTAVKELQIELGNGEDTLSPEEQKKLKFSIEQLSKLMDKGMEIYASIDAPDEVKDLFPTSDEIKSLNEPIKLLAEETETE